MRYEYGQSKAAQAAARRLAAAQAELRAAHEERQRIERIERAAIAMENEALRVRYQINASGDTDTRYGGREGLRLAVAEIEEHSARKRGKQVV